MNKLELLEIFPVALNAEVGGGVDGFIRKFVPIINKKIPSKLLSIKSHKIDKIYERPILGIKYKDKDGGIGKAYLISLFLKKRIYLNARKNIIHLHRLEYILPFLSKKYPKIITFHTNNFFEVSVKKSKIYRLVYGLLESIILNNPNLFNIQRIVFVDKHSKRIYLKRFPKIKKISSTIAVGIDLNTFRPLNKEKCRKKLELNKRDKILLFVGRLSKEKNLDLLIKIFEGLKDYKLIIIGDGPYKNNLIKATNCKQLKNCFLLGKVKNKDLPIFYNSADLTILTSNYEGMPTTVIESLACGVPVISTNVGGLTDIIKDKKNGFVVKNKENLEYFREMITKLPKLNLKKNCLISVSKYSLKNVVEEYIKILENV